jgi:predicted ATP-grasp superfamily ATP-dependent carboligase
VPPRPTALVTDGLWRKSVSVVRSLGKAGFDVHVMGDSVFTTGFWSRFTRGRIRAPLASTDPDAFGRALVAALESLQRDGDKPVLFPMEDASLMWVSRHRDLIAPLCHCLLPPHHAIVIAQDKGATVRHAREAGLPCPASHEPASFEEFWPIVERLAPGTFVVKPRSGAGSAGIRYGERGTRAEWFSHWERFGPLLVQDRVPREGAGLGVSLLFDRESRCVAAFAHERLRQYPVSGGPSTDRRSRHDPDLVEQSIRLLRQLDWQGIAMVEWKRDPRDGVPKLMEINPRFWGSLELAVRAGVDFPLLFARAARGERLPGGSPSYEAGVRLRWMMPGEVLRFFHDPDREPLGSFLRGLPRDAEEWDPADLRGLVATIACTAVLALNPRYWKYGCRR